MKTVIVEDEKAAVRNLTALLREVRPDTEVIATPDSINSTIEWFSAHPMPDVVFMDIHLADGSAFEIFEHIHITCPIIFTTAYDEYALRAFKVNSIDYLLKPIDKEDMENALAKLERLHGATETGRHTFHDSTLEQLMLSLRRTEGYRTHFLVPGRGDKLLPVTVSTIRLFYIKEGIVKAVLTDGTEYSFSQTLDELADCLDPVLFFRVNRQFLLSREAIRDIDLWFNNRLSINLHYAVTTEKIIISKTRVRDFKEWFAGNR